MTGQSNAAAQGTAIALGSYHTVGLLCRPDEAAPEYALFSMGRGFHGQLGLEGFDNQDMPQRVSGAQRAGSWAGSHWRSALAWQPMFMPALLLIEHLPSPLPTSPPAAAFAAAGGSRGAGCQGASVPRHTRGHPPRRRQRRQQPLGQHLPQVGWLGRAWRRPRLWLAAVVAAPAAHSLHLFAGISLYCAAAATPACRGELYTWGLASSGELGQGGWTPIEVGVPRMITSLQRTRIVSVACGANHTLAISETGQLWSCGRGRHGQVGAAGRRHAGCVLQLQCGLVTRLPACQPTHFMPKQNSGS